MDWNEIFVAFAVSHLVGDFVLQTNWQALNKHGGLRQGNAIARRALLQHAGSYTLAFVPSLIWLSSELSWQVLAVAAGIAIPHVLQDDGRLLAAYMRRVKGVKTGDLPIVALGVDQTVHLVALLLLAIVAASTS